MWGAGCGVPEHEGDTPAPRVRTRFASPLQVYREMGLLTGTDDFPAVADFATLAGRGDSTLVLFGLSLPNSSLQFHRDGNAFSAGYIVSIRFLRDDELVRVVDRQETVRVADFAETARSEETVVFQSAVQLEPGSYGVGLRVRDRLSARGFEVEETLVVPAFHPAGRALAGPIPVLRAAPRAARRDLPDLVMNPRHSASYGGTAPRFYLERYDSATVELELRTAADSLVWARALAPASGTGPGAFIELPVDSLPPGRLALTARSGSGTEASVPLLVTLSEAWVVANMEEVLSVLRYIAMPDELEELQQGGAAEKRARWDAFWEARDPMPATPVNEFRESFFQRIRIAIREFGEPARPGWLTDRGEVYIVLGPPSRHRELRPDRDEAVTASPNGEEWVYDRVPGGGRLSLVFLDRSGFGMLRLTPASGAAFRAVAERARRESLRR